MCSVPSHDLSHGHLADPIHYYSALGDHTPHHWLILSPRLWSGSLRGCCLRGAGGAWSRCRLVLVYIYCIFKLSFWYLLEGWLLGWFLCWSFPSSAAKQGPSLARKDGMRHIHAVTRDGEARGQPVRANGGHGPCQLQEEERQQQESDISS